MAIDILDGEPARKMKAANGQKMTDQDIVTQLAQSFPRVRSVYEHTSRFVHLSEKHYFAALRVSHDPQEQPGTFSGYISVTDQYLPTTAYVEALEGFPAT